MKTFVFILLLLLIKTSVNQELYLSNLSQKSVSSRDALTRSTRDKIAYIFAGLDKNLLSINGSIF